MSYDSRLDVQDSRSRRHDSFTKQRDYLTPSYQDRPRERSRSRSRRDPRYDEPRYSESRYDEHRSSSSAYSRSQEEQRVRTSRRPRSPRLTWPPQPTVESERQSLYKELGGERVLLANARNEIPSRGTVDQDPLILDVPEYMHKNERRFVRMSDDEKSKSAGIPTPPTSEDERLRKMRRRPSRLNTDSQLPPEMQKRNASPYNMQKSAGQYKTSDLLSPDVQHASASDSHRRQGEDRRTPRSSPTRQRTYPEDNRAEARDSGSGSDTSRARRQEPSKTGLGISPATSASSSVVGENTRQPESSRVDRSYKPSPLVIASTLGEAIRSARDTPRSAGLNTPDFRREASLGSRNVSPAASIHSQRSSSPPPALSQHSSRHSVDYSQDSPESRRTSAIISQNGSRPSTPPFGSVAMPKMPVDNDWSDMLASNISRRTGDGKAPSRLSNSMRADSMPSVPRSVSYNKPSALPYPVHDGPMPDVYMPSETDHQFYPPKPTQLDIPDREPIRKDRLPSPTTSRPMSIQTQPRQARHSFTSTSPTEAKKTRPETISRSSYTSVAPSKQEADAMLKRGMPLCRRSTPTADYDDWYTLLGAPDMDFCPDCVETTFDRTVYRNQFRRSVPRDRNLKKFCAFGTPWIRLAYLLTVQQRMSDLRLLKEMAEIEATSSPCPGNEEAVRTWHGVKDDKGLFVRDFQICYTDVRKIERLLPSFTGFFPRLPNRASYEKKRCALRANTNRFDQYLGSIVGLHEQAYVTRSLPDPMEFVSLVERKLSLRECERDVLLLDSVWHYIPQLQDFTVCEDCFEDVVEPEIKKGSEIAKRFNRTVAPAYGEGRTGTSCQLYSPRMRKVFNAAIKDNDFKYLARKARERRDAELRLQDKLASVVRRAQRFEYEQRGSGSDDEKRKMERDVQRDVRKIADEWKNHWE